MPTPRATVTCPSCGAEETFDRLGAARSFVETHRDETGHDPDWTLGRLDSGVERAGDLATVCGREDGDCGGPLTSVSRDRQQ